MEKELSHEQVISTSRLTKAFDTLVAVNDLHLEVLRGDVFGFLGPNGSGKTTTIRMLLGLIRPTAGSISLFGLDNSTRLPEILPRVGAIVVVSIPIVVDLPAPFGPSRPNTSPFATANSISFTASTPPG